MKKIIMFVGMLLTLVACDPMDENYKEYLQDIPVYSPKVVNLVALPALNEATLTWENQSSRIVKNIIQYEEVEGLEQVLVKIELTAADVPDFSKVTYKLENLKLRGYQVFVYSVDASGNLSIPLSVNFFPNGEVN